MRSPLFVRRPSSLGAVIGFPVATMMTLALAACSAAPSDTSPEVTGSVDEAIVDVEHTPVERQAIGNCWLYSHASWVESMHKTATGEEFDVSQSYWTYWHWFDQITGGSSRSEISTGGSWRTANRIVQRYGMVAEKDFIAADTEREMSAAQGNAELRINLALGEGGPLADREARKDRALVRRVLDEVWGLDRPENAAAKALLDQVFGPAVERTLTGRTPETTAVTAGTPVLRAEDFAVSYAARTARTGVITHATKTFADAIREWREVSYPWSAKGRRTFQKSVQVALHERQPVLMSWSVDFNALENGVDNPLRGSFNMTTLQAKYAIPSLEGGGPGRQGGHLVVLEDYQVKTTGFGVLTAGVTLDATNTDDQAKLAAALADDSEVQFFRIKNSWGASRFDRSFVPGFPGYHDLYMDYLNGPIQWCSDPDDADDDAERGCSASSWGSVPLSTVVLPPGFDLSRRF